MILSGKEIVRNVASGAITLTPFLLDQINPNSYDLTLGNKLLRYCNTTLDPSIEQPVEEEQISASGLVLEAGSFRLGASNEVVGSSSYVPILHAKSGIARLGLFVHVTADLIDVGSVGNLTFQLYSTLRVRLRPGMRLAQVSFWSIRGEIDQYMGKYQGSVGPQKSRSYLDPFWNSSKDSRENR